MGKEEEQPTYYEMGLYGPLLLFLSHTNIRRPFSQGEEREERRGEMGTCKFKNELEEREINSPILASHFIVLLFC